MTWKKNYIFFIYFLIIFTIYSPTYLFNYAFSDDWALIDIALNKKGSLFQWDVQSGRPLYAVIQSICLYFIKDYKSLIIFRLICVLTIYAFCCQLFSFLYKRKIFDNLLITITLPLAICFLPAIQVYAAWVSCFSFVTSLLFAGFSYAILIPYDRTSSITRWIISILFLCCSFAIYQPTAMGFLFFVFLDNFIKERKKFPLSNLTKSAIVLCIGMIFSLILSKYLPKLLYGYLLDRSQLTSHFLEKLNWFIKEPLINAINNFNIYPHRFFTILSTLLLVIGIKSICKNKNVFIHLLSIIAIILISYIPCLLVNQDWAAYRSLIALELILSTLVLLGFFTLVQKLNIKLYASLFLIALLSTSVIFNIVNEFIIPQQSDFAALSAKISSIIDPQFDGILMFDIDEPALTAFVNTRRYDEFGATSSNIPWAIKGIAEQIKKNKKMKYSLVDDGVIHRGSNTKCLRKDKCIIINTGDAMRQASYKY